MIITYYMNSMNKPLFRGFGLYSLHVPYTQSNVDFALEALRLLERCKIRVKQRIAFRRGGNSARILLLVHTVLAYKRLWIDFGRFSLSMTFTYTKVCVFWQELQRRQQAIYWGREQLPTTANQNQTTSIEICLIQRAAATVAAGYSLLSRQLCFFVRQKTVRERGEKKRNRVNRKLSAAPDLRQKTRRLLHVIHIDGGTATASIEQITNGAAKLASQKVASAKPALNVIYLLCTFSP